jgi:hypothetical protein
MSLADRQQAFTDMTTAHGGTNQSIVKSSKNGDQINIGFDSSSVDGIVNATQNLMDGLAC